ncbi:unnamed protein product [Orchesella dallaii]|uniref:Caprin-1 dimerization domain-containing protein n=1 Tax=Orchesella dallaii TaxID=48710 RepID=A0ABP1RX42_9HEXA
MPAATTGTSVAPEPTQQQVWYRPTGDKMMEPFVSPITAAEHKIRNLEKRKLKLDQYRSEQAEGKTLNADQLAAVAKYNEVIQQLELSREMVSCLRQVHQQTSKFIRQELRRENAERNKFVLSLIAGLDQLQNPKVQRDFLQGELGPIKATEEDLTNLMEVLKLVKPSLREPDFSAKVEAGAEAITKLFESRGQINNKPSHQLKPIVEALVGSQYFTTVPTVVEEELPPQELPNQDHPLEEVSVCNGNPVPALLNQQGEASFSFVQESKLENDINSAGVVASSAAPRTAEIQPENMNNQELTSAPSKNMTNISTHSGDRELGANHTNSKIEEEAHNDNGGKIKSATFYNTASANGNIEDEEEHSNGYPRSGRGSYRGRGGRGRGGSYEHGNSKPFRNGGSRGGYHQSSYRGGVRAERMGQSDAETAEFRGKGGRGNFQRSYRGTGTNGSVPHFESGPGRRGGRGTAKSFNENNQSHSYE